MGRSRAKQYWLCHGKDHKGEPSGYQVPCGKVACNSCGLQPPLHVSCPSKAAAGKSGCKAGDKDDKPKVNALQQKEKEIEDIKRQLKDERKKEKFGPNVHEVPQAEEENRQPKVTEEIKRLRADVKFDSALDEVGRRNIPDHAQLPAACEAQLGAAYEKQREGVTPDERKTIAVNFLKKQENILNAIRSDTTRYNRIQYNAIQYNTIQHNIILCNTIQYNTTHYSTMQHDALQHITTQRHTI